MKYFLSLLIFFLIVFHAVPSPGKLRFGILLKEHIAERPVRKVGTDTCTAFLNLITQLLIQDQKVRAIDEDSASVSQQISDVIHHLKITHQHNHKISTASFIKINQTDSITFYRLKQFSDKYGLMQLNRENFPDSITASKLMFDFNTILIHMSSKYGFEIMGMYEKAIQRNTCNETDLLNYLITYLWRQTEFDRSKRDYFIVPLPDFDKSPLRQTYLNAIRIFINRHVKTSPNIVQYMVFANYFTLPQSQFLLQTALINKELQKLGTAQPYVQLADLKYYLTTVSGLYPAYREALQNATNKYYFVCNNLGIHFGPYQNYID